MVWRRFPMFIQLVGYSSIPFQKQPWCFSLTKILSLEQGLTPVQATGAVFGVRTVSWERPCQYTVSVSLTFSEQYEGQLVPLPPYPSQHFSESQGDGTQRAYEEDDEGEELMVLDPDHVSWRWMTCSETPREHLCRCIVVKFECHVNYLRAFQCYLGGKSNGEVT